MTAGDQAMLAYAEQLTLNPSSLTKADFEILRTYFSEEQAFDIVIIASLFNFIDRIADAFGVQLDPMIEAMARASAEGEALPELSAAVRARAKD